MSKLLVNRYFWWGVGLSIGALAGYIYYLEVGCASGSCAITSNPWRSSLYGGAMGVLLFDGLHKKDMWRKNN
ncbi:MAG: hypothetical protein HWD92_09560 [Flavobacteriia bacterium]|nr:hypothetical protein [Flavobacteriia bacterium]